MRLEGNITLKTVHHHYCFVPLLEQWVVMLFIIIFTLWSPVQLPESILHHDHTITLLPFPIHPTFLSTNTHFCSHFWYQVLKGENDKQLPNSVLSFKVSPLFHWFLLTISPAHLWPPLLPSHFITNLACVRGMIHRIIKLRVEEILKVS